MSSETLQLVIASNRLPCTLIQEEGHWRVRPGSGGLVTAMAPVLRDRGGVWIGWPGTVTEDELDVQRMLDEEGRRAGYTLTPVALSEEEKGQFYHGFANEVVWPLFHSLDERCNFDPAYWEAYERVNRRFAEVIAQTLKGTKPYIWVHDYHLMMVGAALRQMGVDSDLAFFLHTPFPPGDIFMKLPWRFDVLRGLLSYNLIGFQTLRDRSNFARCVRTLLRDCAVRGRGQVQTVISPNGEVRAGAFPISIDYGEFERAAKSPAATESVKRLREEFEGQKLVLGVDRLDYTKGIPYRLKGFGRLLERYPELHRKVTLVQVVVPSRTGIPAYEALREEIGELVGEINGAYAQPGWVPVQYFFRSLPRDELVSYYRAADVALVTPLIDGMNLVSKEYCACNVEEQGVLILSEFAGSAAELQLGAILVNPYDIEGVAEAIRSALTMEEKERTRRMRRLRQAVRRRDVFRWLDTFLSASIARRLDDFPPVDQYIPSEPRSQGAAEAAVNISDNGATQRVSAVRTGAKPRSAPPEAVRTNLSTGV